MENYTIIVKNTSEGLRLNGNLCKIISGKRVTCIENGSVGIGHTAHSNIDVTGSIKGMKSKGFWGKHDLIVKERGFYYNMSMVVIGDDLDALAFFIEKGGILPLPPIDERKETKFNFSI